VVAGKPRRDAGGPSAEEKTGGDHQRRQIAAMIRVLNVWLRLVPCGVALPLRPLQRRLLAMLAAVVAAPANRLSQLISSEIVSVSRAALRLLFLDSCGWIIAVGAFGAVG
jgi:hypothetical protein